MGSAAAKLYTPPRAARIGAAFTRAMKQLAQEEVLGGG
jgi:hypothetical protein